MENSDEAPSSKASNSDEAPHRLTPGPRPRKPPVLPLLIIVYALLELMVLGFLFDRRGGFEVYGLAWTALVILMWNQTVLLAGWLAWGDGSVLIRLATLIGVTFVSHGLTHLAATHLPVADLLVMSMGQALLTAAPLLVARCFGWACRTEEATPRHPWQYSLTQIILLTLIVAVAMRLLLWVPWQYLRPNIREHAMLLLSTAALGWIVWPTMLSCPPAFAYVAAAVVAFWEAFAASLWMPSVGLDIFLMFTVQAALLAGCVHVFRAAGYRLRRAVLE